MLLSLVPGRVSATALAQESCRKLNGFDLCGRFLEEWNRPGSEQNSLYVNGLPITARRPEISLTDGQTYDVQWFERARYEAHPENKRPYDVLLGLLGVMLTDGRGKVDPHTNKVRNAADQPFLGIDKPSDADGKSRVWFPETRHSISGKFLEHWNRYGGIKQFGFPLTEQFDEIQDADGKRYTVQYFERNRIEMHPDKPPPYDVQFGLLGAQQYRTIPVPADQLPIAPPKGVISTKDTLTIGMSYEPDSLFPLFSNLDAAKAAARPLYNGLVARDSRDNLYPEVAWYVPTLENNGAYWVGLGDDRHLAVKYKLRRGIKWADGKEITSNDVIFHRDLIMDPRSPVEDRTLWGKLYNFDNPDKYTAIFNFMSYAQARDIYNAAKDKSQFEYLRPFVVQNRPVVDPTYNTIGDILPAHILAGIPPDRIARSSYGRSPLASGPFQVAVWAPGSELVLVPNPSYNLTAPPLLKKIVIKFISSTDQIVARLRTGELDAATSDAFLSPTEVLNTVGPDQKVEYVPSRSWEQLDFNLTRPYFQEKVVRQAIMHAINRQKIVDDLMLGKSTVLHAFLPPSSWSSMQNPDFAKEWESKFSLKRYDYNPAKAEFMLDEAGWLKGADGIRAKNGVRLSFLYGATTGSRTRATIGQSVIQDLRKIGIETTYRSLPPTIFFDDGGYLEARQFDLAGFTVVLDVEPNGTRYDSQYIPSPQNNYTGTNYSGYRNPRFDQLARQEVSEVERSARAPLFAEMQSIIAEDVPSIPLYTRLHIEVHKVNLMNWDTSGGTTYTTYKAAAMYFK
jgi:peptide/nickel transport system substrate-binding protein